MKLHFIETSESPAAVKYDREVQVIDIGFPRTPDAKTSVWVIRRVFATVEESGKIVDIEIPVPAPSIEARHLIAPPIVEARYSIYVDEPGAASSEEYAYDVSQSLLCIRFGRRTSRASFYPLSKALAVEAYDGTLRAIWLLGLHLDL